MFLDGQGRSTDAIVDAFSAMSIGPTDNLYQPVVPSFATDLTTSQAIIRSSQNAVINEYDVENTLHFLENDQCFPADQVNTEVHQDLYGGTYCDTQLCLHCDYTVAHVAIRILNCTVCKASFAVF